MSRIFCKCMFVSEESGLVILFSFSRTFSILVYIWGSEWNWYWCYWSNNCWIVNKPVDLKKQIPEDPFKIYIFQVTNALWSFLTFLCFLFTWIFRIRIRSQKVNTGRDLGRIRIRKTAYSYSLSHWSVTWVPNKYNHLGGRNWNRYAWIHLGNYCSSLNLVTRCLSCVLSGRRGAAAACRRCWRSWTCSSTIPPSYTRR